MQTDAGAMAVADFVGHDLFEATAVTAPTNKQIGARLFLSPRTAAAHLPSHSGKLDVPVPSWSGPHGAPTAPVP
ncbi:hypothetical protein [Streptomyces sp. MBT53]|uniref:hypothetical protein n=1 Tax=Streptomyces sp. MBT53 TaxID=1488384 RepID=UPI0019116971|nr:hypothetical protein [Streptomyces sp. MBT53]MBK6010936.1 hypothetical protein [Streptomyces sp. MBT53]